MFRNRTVTTTTAVTAALIVLLIGIAGAIRPVWGQEEPAVAPLLADAQAPVAAAFSYQGRLQRDDAPFSGSCNFQFSLWDAATAGVQKGNQLSFNALPVEDGLFTIGLDFGNQFTGEARWLETAVKCAGDADFITLEPRQPLTAVPYAIGLLPGTRVESKTDNGLWGIANAEGRAGLVGVNNGNGGFGVYGSSPNGGGVVGFSTNWIGIYGETEAPATTGAAGVYGLAKGNQGMGVAGRANEPDSIGVKGSADASGGVGVWGESAVNTGVFGISPAGKGVWGASAAGTGVFGNSDSWAGVWGESKSASGVVGVSSNEFSGGVYGLNQGKGYGVYGKSDNGAGVFGKSTKWVGVYGETAAAGVAAIWGKNTTGGVAGRFDGTVQITGGSDLAERFVVTGNQTKPGTLLVIDANNPGQLKASRTAYDTAVVGIVSGANGVEPGLTLHQEGVLEGDTIVAIAGRVYVLAEADSAPIKPGDLLTTSDLAGHAMKAANRDRAYGAVIGKALTELDSGTGMVLVMVNLQ